MGGGLAGAHDLGVTPLAKRTWVWQDFARMWTSILVNPTGYILGASLPKSFGLDWWQAALAVLVGSCILLVALVSNAMASTTYGIPFPVFARAAFGFEGSKLVAVLRGVIAIYYMSINMWIGASGLEQGLVAVWPSIAAAAQAAPGSSGSGLLPAAPADSPGDDSSASHSGGGGEVETTTQLQLALFFGYALVHVAIFLGDGVEVMRLLAKYIMPVQVVGLVGIFIWGVWSVPMDDIVTECRSFQPTSPVHMGFVSAVTTVISGWSTMSLNIGDISRFSVSQRDQALGQALGFVLPNTLVATIGRPNIHLLPPAATTVAQLCVGW